MWASRKVMKEEAECSANQKRAQDEQRHANEEMDKNTPRVSLIYPHLWANSCCFLQSGMLIAFGVSLG